MASGGQSGFGTTLGGSTAGAIGEITAISLPGYERTAIDITTMASVAGWREFVGGLMDAGEITLTVWYTNALCTVVAGLIDNVAETWTITLPDTHTWACSGFVTSLGGDSPMDDGVVQNITIKLSGQPTYT